MSDDATVFIILPGLLAATLLIDLLRAFAWLPAGPEMAMGWTIAFAALMTTKHARATDMLQWGILGSTLAAAMIAAVLTGSGLAAWAGPLDEPHLIVIPLVLASLFTALFIGWAVRRIAHRLAGEDSPWRLRGYRNTETNHKGRKT